VAEHKTNNVTTNQKVARQKHLALPLVDFMWKTKLTHLSPFLSCLMPFLNHTAAGVFGKLMPWRNNVS